MTKKEELLKVFQDVKDVVNVFQQEVEKIKNNSILSESGRDQKIKELQDEWLKPRIQEYHDQAVKVIESARAAAEKSWTDGGAGKLTDAGYQTGLANVLQMLSLKAIPAAGFSDVIEVYKDDLNALNAIRAIVDGYEEHLKVQYLPSIPHDTRVNSRKAWKQLIPEIDSMINMELLNSHNAGMGFEVRKKYLFDELGDDLTVSGNSIFLHGVQ